MADFLSRRAGVWRWSVAIAVGVGLHAIAFRAILPGDTPPAAVVAPESVVMIDLPPEPELPPLESVEQAAVEEVTEEVPEVVETPTELPEVIEETEVTEPEIEVEPEPVEMAATEPEMVPPSEVAIPLPLAPPPEMVETTEVKPKKTEPKPKPKKVERPKPETPPADAQVAGAGSGADLEEALAAYRSAVRRAIVSRRRASDADGAIGRAVVQLRIARDGSIIALSADGGPAVAAAAERLIRRVGSFPAIPTGLPAPFAVTVPIDFRRE
jgi:protein TonB